METEKPKSVVETPAHPPIKLNERAYFFDPRHREFVNDPTAPLSIYRMADTAIYLELSVLFSILLGSIVLIALFLSQIYWILIVSGLAVFFMICRVLQKLPHSDLFNPPSKGEVVLGKIISCTEKLIENRAIYEYQYEITTYYLFPIPSGHQLIGTDSRQHTDTIDGLPPKDTPVYVLYFSDTEHYLL
jgi:hypothetical protein